MHLQNALASVYNYVIVCYKQPSHEVTFLVHLGNQFASFCKNNLNRTSKDNFFKVHRLFQENILQTLKGKFPEGF